GVRLRRRAVPAAAGHPLQPAWQQGPDDDGCRLGRAVPRQSISRPLTLVARVRRHQKGSAMVTTPVASWSEALLTSLTAALALFLAAIPKVIGFVVILIIGWLVAAALAKAVAALLRAVRFNE